jgi:hypothetical protein
MPTALSAGAYGLAALLATCFIAPAFAAQQNIGATESAKNQVSRELAGAAGALSSGDPVFRNEVVKTSRVVLDRFVYEGADSTQTVAVKLSKGLFRFTTGSLDKNAYSVTTPAAAIGVRGTILDISVQPRKTKVTLREGRAIVCPVDKGAAFEQLARDCSHEKGRECRCTGLDQPGETVEVTTTASGGTTQTLSSVAVNFEPFCAGGLCDATDYATLTNGNTDLASSIDGPGGGGASLCGR